MTASATPPISPAQLWRVAKQFPTIHELSKNDCLLTLSFDNDVWRVGLFWSDLTSKSSAPGARLMDLTTQEILINCRYEKDILF